MGGPRTLSKIGNGASIRCAIYVLDLREHPAEPSSRSYGIIAKPYRPPPSDSIDICNAGLGSVKGRLTISDQASRTAEVLGFLQESLYMLDDRPSRSTCDLYVP